jgi:hypothetical protein
MNALSIAPDPALNAADRELILRALDTLDHAMQAELANKGQDAAVGETRSRILIVRTKLNGMQVAPMSGPPKKATRARPTPPTTVNDEMRRLQKLLAVLVCIQAAAEEGTDFDVGDALAVVVALVDETLRGLDRLEVAHGGE